MAGMPDLDAAIAALGPEAGRIYSCQLDRAARVAGGPLAGLAVSVKDNIDVEGVTTTAGSAAFRSLPPATHDAPVVARLRAAGATVYAKTLMTEFAYSAHGINAHYGTPANPRYPTATPHTPGGSSSGAAVAVARHLGDAAIGTDTAGSVRIPAALCGVVGLKPRQQRIPRDGIVPLSHTYDCVGVLARGVARVARVFAALADPASERPACRAGAGGALRLLVREAEPDEAPAQTPVAEAFAAAVARLERDRRFEVIHAPLPLYREALAMLDDGGLTAPEAYSFHAPYLERFGELYEPFTRQRLAFGRACSPARYQALLSRRRALVASAAGLLGAVDAVVQATCPILAPAIAALDPLEARAAASFRLISHTTPANVLDLASLTLPCEPAGAAPVGLLLDSWYSDEFLLELGAEIEALLAN